MNKLGIKSEIIKSGKFKGQPNPAEDFLEEARQATTLVINDLFNMFVDMIVQQRSLKRMTVLGLSDGRLYSGRMAKDLGLVDLIGTEKEAVAWLEKTHKIGKNLPIFDIKPIDERGNWSKLINGILGESFLSYGRVLGGVLSLWHPT
jgi:protease-4